MSSRATSSRLSTCCVQILTEPVFPQTEVARQVRTRLAEIDQERAHYPPRSRRAGVRAHLLCIGRPLVTPHRGTRDRGADPPLDDVAAFHKEHIVAAKVTMVVAGDLEGLDVPSLVDAAPLEGLGERSSGARPLPRPPGRHRHRPLAHRPRLAPRVGADRDRRRRTRAGSVRRGGWAPYPVLGFVLAGSPNARVDAVLREEKGYTYGIRSSFRPRRAGDSSLTSGSVRADSTAESLRLLVEILESGSKGFSDKEIRSGVDFISKTAPGRYATADAIGDEAVGMALDGRTTEFVTSNLRDLAHGRRTPCRRGIRPLRRARRHRRGPTRGRAGRSPRRDADAHLDAISALGLGDVTVVCDHEA